MSPGRSTATGASEPLSGCASFCFVRGGVDSSYADHVRTGMYDTVASGSCSEAGAPEHPFLRGQLKIAGASHQLPNAQDLTFPPGTTTAHVPEAAEHHAKR